jgi:poly(A) polymerase
VSSLGAGEALRAVRVALGDTPAWLVGGAPRDRALGRETSDLDVVVDGAPAQAARAIAKHAAGTAACFELSEEFAGWRVVASDRAWQVDVQPLRGGTLEADLALRDFTVGAIAEPVAGGEPIDPLGGLSDLAARRLRMASPSTFADDPLRVLRLVRLALDLGFDAEPGTAQAARAAAPELARVAGERVFMELRRIIAAPHALDGLTSMDTLGITAIVLPELQALRGVGQSRDHHLDAYGHTREVLERTIALEADPAALLADAELAKPVAALLAEPLADELTRGQALRWGALLAKTGIRAKGECLPASVDAAKPLTAAPGPAGHGVTCMGDDVRGAELAREVLERLRVSERLRAHVAALVRHHLRLGLLVHDPQPLARRTVFDYLQATSPVEVDVTLLSVADRLAGRDRDRLGRYSLRLHPRIGQRRRRVSPGFGRGDRAEEAIAAHMRLARAMLIDALRWRAQGAPRPLWRGDRLAAALDIPQGPRLGAVLRELATAQFAGEIATPEQALAHARELVEAGSV